MDDHLFDEIEADRDAAITILPWTIRPSTHVERMAPKIVDCHSIVAVNGQDAWDKEEKIAEEA